MLLATISDRAGAPIFGTPAREIRAVVNGGDVDDLVAAVHSAPPGLKIAAYVEIVGQAHARRGLGELGPKRPPVAEWREADPGEPPVPPPWIAAGFANHADWRAAGAPSCETASGGAS